MKITYSKMRRENELWYTLRIIDVDVGGKLWQLIHSPDCGWFARRGIETVDGNPWGKHEVYKQYRENRIDKLREAKKWLERMVRDGK